MPELIPQLARLVAATALVAATSAGLTAAPAAPAAAAGCSGARGVTVVVDHGALGGGVQEVCSGSGGGQTAVTLFTGSGFALTYVQRQPGFVCRIDGQPASDPCVTTPPDDAYWGLWWSDGKSGSWSYSAVAAASLKVPDGGYVAFAWQSGGQRPPGVPATAHATLTPSSSPTVKPSTKPTTTPTTRPSTKPSATPSTKPSPPPTTATATASLSADPASADIHGSTATPTPTAPSSSATESATTGGPATTAPASEATSAAPTADPADAADTGGSLPVWVVPVVLVLLAGAGVAIPLLRRRRGSSS